MLYNEYSIIFVNTNTKTMKPFSKTYYTDTLNITIRIKRNELCSMGCRLTIKEIGKYYNHRILYTWFPNNKDMFKWYRRNMTETKIPKKTIDSIVEDIKINLLFEKVVTYQPITKKMLWD